MQSPQILGIRSPRGLCGDRWRVAAERVPRLARSPGRTVRQLKGDSPPKGPDGLDACQRLQPPWSELEASRCFLHLRLLHLTQSSPAENFAVDRRSGRLALES